MQKARLFSPLRPVSRSKSKKGVGDDKKIMAAHFRILAFRFNMIDALLLPFPSHSLC